jgi:alpha-mannosidase
MSWALNNHWLVNFKASQSGEIPLRYRLTTHTGGCDDAQAGRFGAEQATPVISMRDLSPKGARTGQFVTSSDGDVEVIHIKPASFGEGIIVRVQNIANDAKTLTLTFAEMSPRSATLVSPDERDGERASINGNAVEVPVAGRAVQSVRVVF